MFMKFLAFYFFLPHLQSPLPINPTTTPRIIKIHEYLILDNLIEESIFRKSEAIVSTRESREGFDIERRIERIQSYLMEWSKEWMTKFGMAYA